MTVLMGCVVTIAPLDLSMARGCIVYIQRTIRSLFLLSYNFQRDDISNAKVGDLRGRLEEENVYNKPRVTLVLLCACSHLVRRPC